VTAWSWIRSGWVAKTVILLLAMTFILNRPPVRAMNLLATPVGTETNLLVIVRIFTEELLGPRDTGSMGAIRILIGFGMNVPSVIFSRVMIFTSNRRRNPNTSSLATLAGAGTTPRGIAKTYTEEALPRPSTEIMGAIRILIGFGMNALQVTSFRATTCTTSLPSGRNTSISVTHAVTGTIPLITVKLFIGEDGEIVVKKQK
jgi:hypothetical protein